MPSDNDRRMGHFFISTQWPLSCSRFSIHAGKRYYKQYNVKYKKQPIVLFAVEHLVSIGKQVMTDHKGDDEDTRFLSILGVNSNMYYKESKLNSMFVVSFLIFLWCMGYVRGHIFNRPVKDDLTNSLGIKTRYTPRAVVRLVSIFNCLAYDWVVKDEWKVRF